METRRSPRLAAKRGEPLPEEQPAPPNSPKPTRRRAKKTNVGWLPPIVEENEASSASNSNTNNETPPPPRPVRAPRQPLALPPPREPSARVERMREQRLQNATRATETKYFKYDHIFQLAGHGYSNVEDNYVLQPNEFYTTPTTCGRLAWITNVLQFIKFTRIRPVIYIPKPENTDFFPNIEISYLRNPTAQRNSQSAPVIHESHAYKMYVPFVEQSGSNTIYNTSIAPLLYWTVSDDDIRVSDDFTFTYKTKTRSYTVMDTGFMEIYKITISGVLSSGHRHSSVALALEEPTLRDATTRIIEAFGIPRTAVSSMFFYVPISSYHLELPYDPDREYDDPFVLYLRDVIAAVYSDSILTPRQLYGETIKIMDFFYKSIPMSTLYPKIRATLDDDAPIIVMNELCRNYRPSAKTHIVNSNENVDPRSYMPKFTSTLRGKNMKSHMKSALKNYTKRTYGKYAPLRGQHTSADKKYEIMKYIVKMKKLTHSQYKHNPRLYSRYLAHLTSSSAPLWANFLATLPKKDFYRPNVDE